MKFFPPLLGLLLASTVHGASLLLKYDFEGNTMSPTTTTDAALLIGSPVSADVPNTTGTSDTTGDRNLRRWLFSDLANSTQWGDSTPLIRVQREVTSLELAVANNSYFSIDLTPGADLALTTITLDIASTNASYPFGMTVRSSLTGTTDLFSADANGQLPETVNVDLTAHAAFATVEDPVTFYFYLYEYSGANALNFYADNISIYGVPEPGVTALCGLGAVGLLLRRQRRNDKITSLTASNR